MELCRRFLRAFGLSNEARVQITAPGIEVVLTGDPDEVRALLPVVRGELERRRPRAVFRRHALASCESQIVRPTELDEMDSPYALPEPIVRPVDEDELTTDEGDLSVDGLLPLLSTEQPSECVTVSDESAESSRVTEDLWVEAREPETTARIDAGHAGARR